MIPENLPPLGGGAVLPTEPPLPDLFAPPSSPAPRAIETIRVAPDDEVAIEEDLFDANDAGADRNRSLLARHGLKAVDIMGAIGSGKTTLVTRLVERCRGRTRVAVINGDPVTAEDVVPIAAQGVPVIQIAADACHLDSDMVARAYDRLPLADLDLILVENVGNLICPGEFQLGSHARMVVISVTEGPWMVRKHPRMFLRAQWVVINKLDLAGVMGADIDALKNDLRLLKPDLRVFVTSARTGEGLDPLVEALLAL
jgi:hydrogenase nickel incorporation protein HypB